MIKTPKKAMLFCTDHKDREILLLLLSAFAFEVIEETNLNRGGELISNENVDLIFLNEQEKDVVGWKNYFRKCSNSSVQIVLIRKNALHLQLKVFDEDENYRKLNIALDNSMFDQKKLMLRNNRSPDLLPNADLLSVLSHEIFTPLNSVLGFSQLLNTLDFTEAEVKKYSGFIYESGKDIQNKCSSLLELLSLKLGSDRIRNSYFSVALLFNELLSEYEPEKNDLLLNVEYDDCLKDVMIYSDEVKLKKILERLIENAIKFTTHGKVCFGFNLSDNESIDIFVKDTGVGIPSGFETSVFDPFSQVDSSDSRKQGGLGIGLSLVKEFVTLLGGEIIMKSREGQGTCVQIRLPLITTGIDENVEKEVCLKK